MGKMAQEQKLDAAEMRMLHRRACAVVNVNTMRNETIKRATKVGGNRKESSRNKVEMVWAGDENRGLFGKAGDGNRRGNKQERKAEDEEV